jgi:hypothetical protein
MGLMPTLNIETGQGLTVNKEKQLTVLTDPNCEDIGVSENGVFAHAKAIEDTRQYLDNWTVLYSEDSETQIRGNGRVIGRCYTLSFLKVARAWTTATSDADRVRILVTKDPNNATASDLKNANDVIREINFQKFYAAKNSSGNYYEPYMVIRPGTLIAFSDTVHSSTLQTTRICESGIRIPTLTKYTIDGTTVTEPQHIYALFMATRVRYTEQGASSQAISGFPSATPSGYRCMMNLQLRCLWSDTEAFNGLLDTDGWRQGEYLKGNKSTSGTTETGVGDYGSWNVNNIYGAEAIGDSRYTQAW